TFQMHFSTRKSLVRNAANVWSISSVSLIAGGVLYIYVTSTHAETVGRFQAGEELVNVTSNSSLHTPSNAQYRYYSEAETRWMFVFLFGFSVFADFLQCLYPTKDVANSVRSENPDEKLPLKQQVYAIVTVLVHPRVLLFVPRFLSHGLFVSFY
ncbi:hypothetical protein PENTCL1PPCAC_20942, partial [Pristionchus entomophagus]